MKALLICGNCIRIFSQETPHLYFVIDPVSGKLKYGEDRPDIWLPVRVRCPNCGKDISKGGFDFCILFYLEKMIEFDNMEPQDHLHDILFITPEEKEELSDELISYPDVIQSIEKKSFQAVTVKLRKRVIVDKSNPIYKLVRQLYIVDKREKKFKGKIDRMERGLRPILAKIEERGSEAVPYLVRVLYNFDSQAAIFAARLLGKIKDTRAIVPLMDAVEAPVDGQLNHEALVALVNIGEPVVNPLIKRIKSRIGTLSQDELGRRLDVSLLIGALSYIKSEKVYNLLQDLVTDRDVWVYLDIPYLFWCLSNQENTAIIPYLEEIVLEFEDTMIGYSAQNALDVLNDELNIDKWTTLV